MAAEHQSIDPSPGRPESLLARVTRRHKLLAGAIVAAVGVGPNVADVPLLSRWEAWGCVIVFILWAVTAHLTPSRRIATGVVCAALVTFAVVEAVVRLPNESGRPAATGKDARTGPLRVTDLGADPAVTVRGFGRRWVLHTSGLLEGLDDSGTPEVSYHVRGPATGLAACGGALVVTHDHGRVARVSPRSGHVLTDYKFGQFAADVVCGGPFIWVSKPENGSVVQLSKKRLSYIDEFPLVKEVTSISYGGGVVWLLDGPDRLLVGVVARSKEKLGPYAVMADAQQILVVHSVPWILHREQACLVRLDLARGAEVGPGVPLGPYAYRIRQHKGKIYVADYANGTVSVVDAQSERALGNPYELSKHGRIVDADLYRGRLSAIDATRHAILTLRLAKAGNLRLKHQYPRSRECLRGE